jgi:hypothetical protein
MDLDGLKGIKNPLGSRFCWESRGFSRFGDNGRKFLLNSQDRIYLQAQAKDIQESK